MGEWIDVPVESLEEMEVRSLAADIAVEEGNYELAEYLIAQNIGVLEVWIDATKRTN